MVGMRAEQRATVGVRAGFVGHRVSASSSCATNCTRRRASCCDCHGLQVRAHGQLLESVDSNGVVTSHSYDLRQRLTGTTVGGQTTRCDYDAVGQFTRVTQPDDSYIGYAYDDAHRQVAVFDHLGSRIEYTLDNAGNRTAEQVRDPQGVLARQLSRSIDALGRVQQTTGRE